MALLDAVKLVSAKRSVNVTPVQQRRNKLLKALFEQTELAVSLQSGKTYAPTKQKKATNAETGERVTLTVPKRVKQWWWVGENGKLQLSVRYGARVLSLNSNGANAIECADNDVVAMLELVTKAVQAGELDTAIEQASMGVKKTAK